ncbi:hypothetical protein L2E82_16278 [Cichorium intybus]|uniref:Uncharacterized protein n=1 Tax=Cichorium intybus TaxID=13427 RepID=A0ACB9F6A4_CICIN|nr:hypothetical protein L2E82_16278 [Cichorium intybus]
MQHYFSRTLSSFDFVFSFIISEKTTPNLTYKASSKKTVAIRIFTIYEQLNFFKASAENHSTAFAGARMDESKKITPVSSNLLPPFQSSQANSSLPISGRTICVTDRKTHSYCSYGFCHSHSCANYTEMIEDVSSANTCTSSSVH